MSDVDFNTIEPVTPMEAALLQQVKQLQSRLWGYEQPDPSGGFSMRAEPITEMDLPMRHPEFLRVAHIAATTAYRDGRGLDVRARAYTQDGGGSYFELTEYVERPLHYQHAMYALNDLHKTFTQMLGGELRKQLGM